jgi:hypothetical protein
MRQHLRRSRPGRPCRAPARRSRGHRPVGRPGQGVSSAPRIEGEAPYPFQRTSGPAADSVAPSVRPHEHVVGSGSPRCARPQSASTKREAGRGGPRHVPDRQIPASGPARAVPENSIVLRSRFPFRPRRHPGPVRATPSGPCVLAVPPRRRAGRAVEQSRGAMPRPRSPGWATAGRGPPPASVRAAAFVSSRFASVAASPGGTSDDTSSFSPGVDANRDSTFVEKFIHFCGGTVPRQAMPFPSWGRLDNREALEEVVEQREHRVRHSFVVAVRRFDPRKQGLRDPPQGRQGVEGGRVRQPEPAGEALQPPPAGARGPRPRRRSRRRTPWGLPGASRLSRITPRFLALASRRGLARSRTARAAWPRVRPARRGGPLDHLGRGRDRPLAPGSRAALRSGIPSFETLSAVPPSRDVTF